MPRSLPPVPPGIDPTGTLEVWRKALKPIVKNIRTPSIPWNFTATNKRGGNLLSWNPVTGSDGYEITRSDNADFSSGTTTITVNNGTQSQYFDAIAIAGATLPTKYYKLKATAGTVNAPHTVKGLDTGIVASTPLDPSDTVTASTSASDTSTSDDTQVYTGRKRYLSDGL